MMVSDPPTAAMAPTLITKSGSGESCVHRYGPYDPTPHLLSGQLVDSRSWRDGAIAFVAPVKSKLPGAYFTKRGCLMVHDTTVERVTNRVWGIFSSLEHGIAEDNNRRALLRAYIASLAERGEHNADKLTVDGLVYLKNLTSHKKKPVKRRA